jgi:hypothetical protein
MFKRVIRKLIQNLGYDLVPFGYPQDDVDRCVPPVYSEELDSGPPDFVGIGVQRSGTSWWYDLIVQHPMIYHPDFMSGKVEPGYLIKERHFFDRFFIDKFTDQHIAEYYQWFPRPKGFKMGEWTPRYLVDPWVAPLLKVSAPDAKLLVLLRDPVDRFISGMAHARRYGALDPGKAVEHFYRGLYYRQLKQWLHHFSKEQLLVLQYERCVVDTRSELARTYRFLGVDDTYYPQEVVVQKPVNLTRPDTKYELQDHIRAEIMHRYKEDVLQLVKEFPDVDISLWRSL